MEYCGKYSLKNHSTLKIGPLDAKVAYIDNQDDLALAISLAKKEGLIPCPLGGGSNTIFSDSVVDKYLFLIPRVPASSVIPSPLSFSGTPGNPSPEFLNRSHEYFSTEKSPDHDSTRQSPSLRSGPTPSSPASAGMTEDTVLIKISAGLEWDKAVEQTVEMGLSGLEALSWIPGLVGASPVQNIGAYGAEIKDTIHTVHTYDLKEEKLIDFTNQECEFEYRNSIFKKNPGRYFIYAVTFSLLKISAKTTPSVPQYKDVISYFETKKITSPTLQEIREAIIYIRKAKLPDPKETPNAGSYFGNPIVSIEKAETLLKKFPEMPMFDFNLAPSVISSPLSSLRMRGSMDSRIHENDRRGQKESIGKKLFAGWLIDKAGLKGYEKGNFSIHKDHALVIIGNEKGSLSELLEFENYIKQKVFEMFGVELVREPILVGSE
jgi:UDP-N-acetylmuramate dehydrogenase